MLWERDYYKQVVDGGILSVPLALRTVRFGGFLGRTLQTSGYSLHKEVARTHPMYFRTWFYMAIKKKSCFVI